jgi:hypothetical protein
MSLPNSGPRSANCSGRWVLTLGIRNTGAAVD